MFTHRAACAILSLGLVVTVGCDIFESSDSSSSPCGVYPESATSLYVLPFTAGEQYSVLQGNCGNPTHQDLLRFAYDFKIPTGDIVRAGQAIAISGSSGNVITPHLHFDVCETSAPVCRTLPVTFRNAMPQNEMLIQGLFYTALP